MTYDEVIDKLNTSPNLKIDFKEYIITGLDVKNLILDISCYDVVGYIPENQFLDDEEIERYYGDDVNKMSLHYYPYIRIIVKAPNSYTDDKLYVLHLNKVSFTQGLQEIDLYSKNTIGEGFGGINSWIQ